MNQLLTTLDEVSDLLRVSPCTVRRYVCLKQMPQPLKVGKAMLWRRDELMAFLGLPAEAGAKSDAAC